VLSLVLKGDLNSERNQLGNIQWWQWTQNRLPPSFRQLPSRTTEWPV